MARPYFRPVWKRVGQAIADYDLISDGDRIGVAVSGGKDSLLLLWVLSGLKEIAPVRFEIMALMIEMGWPEDITGVSGYCESLGVVLHTKKTNIGPLVFEQRRESNPCSLCSHLRRGALSALAIEHGCNKIALAHHLDDAIETFLLSVFYEGKIRVFSPKTRLQSAGIETIRPLVYVEEASIEQAVSDMKFPVLASSCPKDADTQRHVMKQVITSMAEHNPGIRARACQALKALWGGSLGK